VGDTVFGYALPGVGTYARTTLLLGAGTAREPEGLRDDWAATIPVAATSALDAVDRLGLPRGATVLIKGVGGGVGLAAAQVAQVVTWRSSVRAAPPGGRSPKPSA